MFQYSRRLLFTGNRIANKKGRNFMQRVTNYPVYDKNDMVGAVIILNKVEGDFKQKEGEDKKAFIQRRSDYMNKYKEAKQQEILEQIPSGMVDMQSSSDNNNVVIIKLQPTVINYERWVENKSVDVSFLGHTQGGLCSLNKNGFKLDDKTAISRRILRGYETPEQIKEDFFATNIKAQEQLYHNHDLCEYYIVIKLNMTTIDRNEVAKMLQAEKDEVQKLINAATARYNEAIKNIETKTQEKLKAAKDETEKDKIKSDESADKTSEYKKFEAERNNISWRSTDAACAQALYKCLTGRNLGIKKSAQNATLKTLCGILSRKDPVFTANFIEAVQATGIKVSAYILGKENADRKLKVAESNISADINKHTPKFGNSAIE